MIINLIYGLTTMAVCLSLEILLLVTALQFYGRRDVLLKGQTFWATVRVLSGVMIILVLGNITQVGIWAVLFRLLGEFEEFTLAFYHSAVNFATLGYGDIVMSEKYRLLGPIEAVNGVLMIGISTAVLMAFFQHAMKDTIRALRPKDD